MQDTSLALEMADSFRLFIMEDLRLADIFQPSYTRELVDDILLGDAARHVYLPCLSAHSDFPPWTAPC